MLQHSKAMLVGMLALLAVTGIAAQFQTQDAPPLEQTIEFLKGKLAGQDLVTGRLPDTANDFTVLYQYSSYDFREERSSDGVRIAIVFKLTNWGVLGRKLPGSEGTSQWLQVYADELDSIFDNDDSDFDSNRATITYPWRARKVPNPDWIGDEYLSKPFARVYVVPEVSHQFPDPIRDHASAFALIIPSGINLREDKQIGRAMAHLIELAKGLWHKKELF